MKTGCDPDVEAGVTRLVDQVRKATNNDKMTLPVGFRDVQARTGDHELHHASDGTELA